MYPSLASIRFRVVLQISSQARMSQVTVVFLHEKKVKYQTETPHIRPQTRSASRRGIRREQFPLALS